MNKYSNINNKDKNRSTNTNGNDNDKVFNDKKLIIVVMVELVIITMITVINLTLKEQHDEKKGKQANKLDLLKKLVR